MGISGYGRLETGTLSFRDYFTVHEVRDWNFCVFKIFLSLDSAAAFAQDRLFKRYGDAWFQEFFLTWAVDRIERGLRDNEFADASNALKIDEEDLRLVERIAAEKQCSYQITEGRDCIVQPTLRMIPSSGRYAM